MGQTFIYNKLGSIAILFYLPTLLLIARVDTRNFSEEKVNYFDVVPDFMSAPTVEELREKWKNTVKKTEENGWVLAGNSEGANYG